MINMVTEGQNFKCKKDFKTTYGNVVFKKGECYYSESDGYITAEQDEMVLITSEEFLEQHFEYIPSDSDNEPEPSMNFKMRRKINSLLDGKEEMLGNVKYRIIEDENFQHRLQYQLGDLTWENTDINFFMLMHLCKK